MKQLLHSIFLFAFGLMFVACGPSTPDPVSIKMDVGNEFAYSVTEFSVETGTEVTINLNNTGGLEHNWVLIDGDVDPFTATEDDALYGLRSETAGPGQNASIKFIAPAPGKYQYVCSIPGHAVGGMSGTIEITP